MNLNGTYKISIEMTARKQVQGLVDTANRLLGLVATRALTPPGMEVQIQVVAENLNSARDLFDAFEMQITDDAITVRTSEGELTYSIEQRTDKDESHVLLDVSCEELGALTWDVTYTGRYLFIESIDGISEYVFEKK